MREEFSLTRGTARVSGAGTTRQSVTDALDVSGYHTIDAEVRVYGMEGTGSPDVTFTILTSMQNEKDDITLWNTVMSFTTINTASKAEMDSATSNILRYIRWQAVLNGTTPAFTFTITGIGQRD